MDDEYWLNAKEKKISKYCKDATGFAISWIICLILFPPLYLILPTLIRLFLFVFSCGMLKTDPDGMLEVIIFLLIILTPFIIIVTVEMIRGLLPDCTYDPYG